MWFLARGWLASSSSFNQGQQTALLWHLRGQPPCTAALAFQLCADVIATIQVHTSIACHFVVALRSTKSWGNTVKVGIGQQCGFQGM